MSGQIGGRPKSVSRFRDTLFGIEVFFKLLKSGPKGGALAIELRWL